MKITIVTSESGDWSGVYVDNKLRSEGHSVRYDELLDTIVLFKSQLTSWKGRTVCDDFLSDTGSLPPNLSSIPGSAFIEY